MPYRLRRTGNHPTGDHSAPDYPDGRGNHPVRRYGPAGDSLRLYCPGFAGQWGESGDSCGKEAHHGECVGNLLRPLYQRNAGSGALAQEYADKGVQIVGLLSDANASDGSVSASQVELAQEIVDATGANYLHIIPGEDMMGLLYQITSVPTTFFVDETGKQVGTAYVGAKSKDAWAAIVDQMLEEVA